MKVVFVPGNGNSTTRDNWFPSLKTELQDKGIEVIAADFPDPDLARESIWIPFLLDELKVDQDTILVGHSSGAVASLRLAEENKILGSVLVGVYHTDLDMAREKASGYFNRDWKWDKIRNNQKWVSIFASQDDPWIPIDQARHIHQYLSCEYHEFTNQGHFGGDYVKVTFPELTLSILNNIQFPKGASKKNILLTEFNI